MGYIGMSLPAAFGVATAIFLTQATGALAQAPAPQTGFVSEVRLGVLAHDIGPLVVNNESGIDINGEVLFNIDVELFEDTELRPHLGFSANTAGDTSQVYAGATLTWFPDENFFLEAGGGGAVHDGETEPVAADKKALGCSVLFRGVLGAGVLLGDNHTFSLHYDHISNAFLCDHNEGLETVGVRYGYRF